LFNSTEDGGAGVGAQAGLG